MIAALTTGGKAKGGFQRIDLAFGAMAEQEGIGAKGAGGWPEQASLILTKRFKKFAAIFPCSGGCMCVTSKPTNSSWRHRATILAIGRRESERIIEYHSH